MSLTTEASTLRPLDWFYCHIRSEDKEVRWQNGAEQDTDLQWEVLIYERGRVNLSWLSWDSKSICELSMNVSKGAEHSRDAEDNETGY